MESRIGHSRHTYRNRHTRGARVLFRLLLGGIVMALAACYSVGHPPRTGPAEQLAGSGPQKEIVFLVEPMANFAIHITSVAGLPWPTAYGDLMMSSVSPQNLGRLRQAAPALAWNREHTGELTPYFVFLPAYLRMQDEFELEQYFIGFENAIRRGAYAAFRQGHADGHDRMANWLFDLEGFFEERIDFYQTGFTFIRELGRLYVGQYRDYEERIWPDVERDLEDVASEIESQTWSVDLIATWESFTGERYDGRRFVVSLVAAPMAIPTTGLSYGETLLSVQDDPDEMTRAVSLEFGRHLLIEVFNGAVSEASGTDRLDWTLFAAHQALTEHYNRRIFPGYRSQIDNDVERFAAVFQQLHDQRPEATARQLMRQGLVAFRRETM